MIHWFLFAPVIAALITDLVFQFRLNAVTFHGRFGKYALGLSLGLLVMLTLTASCGLTVLLVKFTGFPANGAFTGRSGLCLTMTLTFSFLLAYRLKKQHPLLHRQLRYPFFLIGLPSYFLFLSLPVTKDSNVPQAIVQSLASATCFLLLLLAVAATNDRIAFQLPPNSKRRYICNSLYFGCGAALGLQGLCAIVP